MKIKIRFFLSNLNISTWSYVQWTLLSVGMFCIWQFWGVFQGGGGDLQNFKATHKESNSCNIFSLVFIQPRRKSKRSLSPRPSASVTWSRSNVKYPGTPSHPGPGTKVKRNWKTKDACSLKPPKTSPSSRLKMLKSLTKENTLVLWKTTLERTSV